MKAINWLRNRHAGLLVISTVSGILLFATVFSLKSIPLLSEVTQTQQPPLLLDRDHKPLFYRAERGWNLHNQIQLHEMPPLLQNIFVFSEDKRFYDHAGVDWLAKGHAIWENLHAMHVLRGASSITEQVIKMLHARPRTVWSKWIETVEALVLETKTNKTHILEFYLNQVPYASERRGVVQAAQYYFNRDISTLSVKETLALVVMARAPSAYDLFSKPEVCEQKVQQLGKKLHDVGILTDEMYASVINDQLQPIRAVNQTDSFHFANFVTTHTPPQANVPVVTTLDPQLQATVKNLLDKRIEQLNTKNVHHGAVMVVDYRKNEILAWAVAGDIKKKSDGAFIDSVLTPRQPGSTLKPFIYGLALEKGWTAATVIKDEPLQTAVGSGLHSYRNYSHVFYGDLTLREALANSLNIPAVKTLEYVGLEKVLDIFRRIGMTELSKNSSVYGVGLALGNGEVSLYELVQAYSVLANHGVYRPLNVNANVTLPTGEVIFSPEVASIITNIISDDIARQLEFGDGNSLFFAVNTAAKTGTSNDHRDAWVMAYNYRYLVGIWMGNLDREPMNKVTGSTGPALLAHSIFTELNRQEETKPLYMSSKLSKRHVCVAMPYEKNCVYRDEWFVPGTEPTELTQLQKAPKNSVALHIQKPSEKLHLAMDPRIPDDLEAFEFALNTDDQVKQVTWYVDDVAVSTTGSYKYLWNLVRGNHQVNASVQLADGSSQRLMPINFTVK